jgi:membrane associated rhomboid family serine protease
MARKKRVSPKKPTTKKSARRSFDLVSQGLPWAAEFIFRSTFVNAIVTLNLAAFTFTHYTLMGERYLPRLVLSPSNLFHGYLWTVFTSGFLHADWSHLLWNMLGLFVFGRLVEEELGTAKTFFLYFGSLLLSMFFAMIFYIFIFHKGVAIIGASGALMGLISAAMLLSPFKITFEMLLPIPTMIKGWMFFYLDFKGLLQREMDGISHLAHLCGFLGITALVYFLSKKDQKRFKTGLFINVVSFILFVALDYWIQTHFV